MSEFKGTKGKWTTSADEKHNFSIVKVFGNTHINEEEQHFNLKLIAHAPELLEMVKLLVDRLEENGFGKFNSVSRAKELIKSATE